MMASAVSTWSGWVSKGLSDVTVTPSMSDDRAPRSTASRMAWVFGEGTWPTMRRILEVKILFSKKVVKIHMNYANFGTDIWNFEL